jgi:cytochrome bd-type quinol oxidase subunit 1
MILLVAFFLSYTTLFVLIIMYVLSLFNKNPSASEKNTHNNDEQQRTVLRTEHEEEGTELW